MRSSLNLRSLPDLYRRWRELEQSQPGLRARAAASQLDCTEAELAACAAQADRTGETDVLGLDISRFGDLLCALADSGSWMFLLRNEAAVLEVDARASFSSSEANAWRFEAERLTVQLDARALGFAFLSKPQSGLPRNLQLFDRTGTALLKLYLKDRKRMAEVDALARPYLQPIDPGGLKLERSSFAAHPMPSANAAAAVYRQILEQARDQTRPVTLRVEHNHGHLEVTHRPQRLELMGPWYNILDRGLNLHLREDLVASASMDPDPANSRARFYDAHGIPVLQLAAELPLAS